jgi:hypothetical protein
MVASLDPRLSSFDAFGISAAAPSIWARRLANQETKLSFCSCTAFLHHA